MSAAGKVLIAAPVHPVLTDWLSDNGYICIIRQDITQVEAPDLLKDVIGIVTSTRLQLNKTLIDAAPCLKWIGRMGSGMEIIDVDYAESKGIACFSSPQGNANAVAEHALGMLLNLTKKITKSNNELRSGVWIRDANRGIELENKTIGIIGFGNTGRSLARKLEAFDMKILAYDKYSNIEFPKYVQQCQDLKPIFEQADIISFHVPLQDDTFHYMNEDFVSKMAKSFILINTSRGVVADTEAIWSGLQNGKISGVCLDVFEEEPINMMNDNLRTTILKIANLPNAVLTPHIAGYSHEAIYKMSKKILERIVSFK